jgi:hypothetical protein
MTDSKMSVNEDPFFKERAKAYARFTTAKNLSLVKKDTQKRITTSLKFSTQHALVFNENFHPVRPDLQSAASSPEYMHILQNQDAPKSNKVQSKTRASKEAGMDSSGNANGQFL